MRKPLLSGEGKQRHQERQELFESKAEKNARLMRVRFLELVSNGRFDEIRMLLAEHDAKSALRLTDIQIGYVHLLKFANHREDIPAIYREYQDLVKVSPSQETVQRVYHISLRAKDIEDIKGVYQATGIRPVFTETELTKLYESLLIESHIAKHIKELKILIDLTGILPPENMVYNAYKDLIGHQNQHARIAAIRNTTGIAIPVSMVEEECKRILHPDFIATAPDKIIALYVLTGVAPSKVYEGSKKKMFISLLMRADTDTAQALVALLPRPVFTSDDAHEVYRMLFLNNLHEKFSNVEEIIGIPLDSNKVPDIYRALIATGSYTDSFLALERISGVKLNPGVMQEGYENFMHDGNSPAIASLRKGTGIEPNYVRNPSAVQEGYKKLCLSGQIYRLAALISMSKVLPALEASDIRAGYVQLLIKGDTEYIDELELITGYPLDSTDITAALAKTKTSVKRFDEILAEYPDMAISWEAISNNIPPDVCESTRRIANKDMRMEVWGLLHNTGEMIDRKTAAAHVRDTNFSFLPPYIQYLFASGYFSEYPEFFRALDSAFASIHKAKKGRSEKKANLEYALMTIINAHIGRSRDVCVPLDPWNFNKNTPAHLTEEVIECAASYTQLIDAFREGQGYARNAEQFVSQALKKGRGIGNLEDFAKWLKKERSELFRTTAGFDTSPQDFARVENEWGNLRPIYILLQKYQSGFSEGMPLFREALQAVFEGTWHDFRYKHHEAKRLLAGMEDVQQAAWIKNDAPVAVGELSLERRNPALVKKNIHECIQSGLAQGHLYTGSDSPLDWAHDLYVWIHGTINGDERFTKETIAHARTHIGLEMFRKTKVKKSLEALGLPSDEAQTDPRIIIDKISPLLNQARQEHEVSPSKKLERKISLLEELASWAREYGAAAALEFDCSVFGVSTDTPLRDLASIKELLDIAYLTVSLETAPAEETRRGGGIPLLDIANRLYMLLKKKNSSFADDIGNIVHLLAASGESGALQDLTLSETDAPKALIESGKYPIGATSCQNYESEAVLNKCLLATLVDADKKLLHVKKPDGTIMARAIIKLVWVAKDSPAIFIEPTYTSLKANKEFFDTQFNQWACKKSAAMGNIPVFRGSLERHIEITIRESRNYHQYEDGGTGNKNAAGLGVQHGAYTMGAYEVRCTA